MTKNLAPGWYPDPADPSRNVYWDGASWHRNGAPPVNPPPQQEVITVGRRKRHPILWLIAIVLLLGWVASQCSPSDKKDGKTSSSESASASPTTEAPDEWKYMPGNGTHDMGGAGGKNWGVWESDGSTGVVAGRSCTWSIRSVAQYRPGIVLDEGEAPSGEKVRVDIEPDGDVSSFDGTIGEDNHRIVFMTNNCGAWEPV